METDNTPFKKILVIDDDLSTRLTLVKVLEKEGYQVAQAENGQQGIQVFNDTQPDLVLLDVIMPVMDGFETCREIRSQDGHHNIPVLMLTGLEDVKAIDQAFSAGATDFITKPINWGLLIRRVRYALRSYATAQNLNLARLRQNHAQEVAKLGFWEWDTQADHVTWSENLIKLFNLPSESHKSHLEDYLQYVPEASRNEVRDALHGLLSCQPGHRSTTFQHLFCTDGKEHMVRVIAECNHTHTVFGVLQDITDLHETEKKLEYQNYHDTLTTLVNRRMFTEQLELALDSNHLKEEPVAIISLDIDRFGLINDTLGHKQGDKLLQLIASRIISTLESQGLAARMGADEFSILLTQHVNMGTLSGLVRRIQSALAVPYQLENQHFYIETSAGVAIAPKDGQTAEELINAADKARITAKNIGGNQLKFFDPDQQPDNSQRLYLENELRKALDESEFVLHYQPQIDLQTQHIIGAEALIRWEHPKLGLVAPNQFVPVIEELELVHVMGDWIANEAVRQAKIWHDQGLKLRVGINLSARQFIRSDLADNLKQTLEQHRLPPKLLDLEITESIAMQNPDAALATLQQLNEIGASLAIDDFGTGYSSLEYLQKFPVQFIKIDRAFIKDILQNPADKAIVKAILGIAESMDMRVIAEGVEQPEEYQLLQDIGCHEVQGYYISRPLTAQQMAQFVQQRNG